MRGTLWWHAVAYEQRDGAIAPAPRAQLKWYDPIESEAALELQRLGARLLNRVPGASGWVDQMGAKLERPSRGVSIRTYTHTAVPQELLDASAEYALDYTRRFGPLGILPHRFVHDEPLWTLYTSPSMINKVVVPVEEISQRWFFGGAVPSPVLFSSSPLHYQYAEPLEEWVLWALAAGVAMRDRDVHLLARWANLCSPLWRADRSGEPRYAVRIPSLLAAIAESWLRDRVTKNEKRLCAGCGKTIDSDDPRCRYCSPECRNRAKQRRHYARHKQE